MFVTKQAMEDLGFIPSDHGLTLLAKRSVNVYSDMSNTVQEGDVITLTGELIGFEGKDVSLQWQYDDGWSWVNVPGAEDLTHSFAATYESINTSWRLSVNVND